MKNSKAMLVILDGFGIAENPEVSAIDKAHKPFYDSLVESCPRTQLLASGEQVGLPDGQFGNSEVGHLNIGAGRIVWQALSRINKDIRDGDFFENEELLKAINSAKKKNKIHLMGLFSDGAYTAITIIYLHFLSFAKITVSKMCTYTLLLMDVIQLPNPE